MDCTKVEQMLDDYMDGVITADCLAALEAHCMNCPECAQKLNATRTMKLLFSELPDETDVPLKTQAVWRSAIKAEAGKLRQKRLIRVAGGLAAALVLVMGATFALVNKPSDHGVIRSDALYADRSVTTIEADGRSTENAVADAYAAMPMHEFSMTVEDLNMICNYMSDLVYEYEGTLDTQRFEQAGKACANLYIEMPADNAMDFLQSVSHYNLDGDAAFSLENMGDADRLSILLVLTEG